MEKTHYKKLQNPDYLGEYEFLPDEEKTVTIKSVSMKEITGPGGKKDVKPVMQFIEKIKPLIVNSTNFRAIAKLYNSPYIEDWTGKQIVLYGDPNVKFGGEIVGGVRIRNRRPVVVDQACADCGQIITGTDKFTAAQISGAAQKQFGRALCMDCVTAIKEKGKEAAQDGDQTEQTN